MPEEGVPVQFCPWVHLSQRWEVLERALQQSSLTEEDHATKGLLSQATHGESQTLLFSCRSWIVKKMPTNVP